MNGLDLFSGIGGISKALEPWVRTVAYCERDRFCQAVLLSRMRTGDIDVAPIWDDITTLDNTQLNMPIDIIFGGFPCQDISCAGSGKGLEGERSGLFFEIVRVAKEIKPSFIFLENVPAITRRGGLRVVREITEMGYDCRWCMLSAAEVGALHKRERWFLLGYTKHHGLSTSEVIRKVFDEREGFKEKKKVWKFERTGFLRNSNSFTSKQANKGAISVEKKQHTWGRFARQCRPSTFSSNWWETEPPVGRMVDGLSSTDVARIRALGNSVVPLQVREAFKMLMGVKNEL